MDRREAERNAAAHILRTTSDVGGRMVLAAFAQDSINQEYGEEPRREEDRTEPEETDHPEDVDQPDS